MRTDRTLPLKLLLLAAACTPLGCEEFLPDGRHDGGTDHCNAEKGPAHVAGTWALVGTADRAECADDSMLEGSIDLSGGPWTVTQIDDQLTIADGPPGFSIESSQVRGICVDVYTREAYRGREARAHLVGQFDGFNLISGTIEIAGPSTCRSEGDFTIEVR